MDDTESHKEALLQAWRAGYEECRADMRAALDGLSGHPSLAALTEHNRNEFGDVLGLRLLNLTQLTVRCRNALYREDVYTVGDLAKQSRGSLLDIRGIGTQAASDCEKLLMQFGLRLQ